MSALNIDDLMIETKKLHTPNLEELQQVLQKSLITNFKEVKVDVIDSPNLKNAPFSLAESGLCGTPTLIEVGGPPYLLPLPDLSKVYDIKSIVNKVFENRENNILVIGAGAGPYMIRNTNCEGIYNLSIKPNGLINNESYTCRIAGADEHCILEKIPNSETRGPLLLNLFASQGKPGKVLRVQCKNRIGDKNFIEKIRLSLLEHYGNLCIGMGGLFILKEGTAKQHVMRDFSKTPLTNETQLNNWLKFFDMNSTLTAVGTFITQEIDLDLRLQHFHSFSTSNWGGHYHYDVTPDIVEYDGYFNVAEKIVRIDKPKNTFEYGKD